MSSEHLYSEETKKILEFADEIMRLKAEVANLVEVLREITEPDPYPEDVFLPISKQELKAIHEMLQKKFKMPIDRLTGHIGRLLYAGIKSKAKEAIKPYQP